MAGAVDDNTTPADWGLAGDELAFVTKVVRSETLAKDLLFDGLDEGAIRWRCHELTIEDPDFSFNVPLTDPPLITEARIDVDWLRHYATRVGPIVQFGSGKEGEKYPIFDLRGSTTVKAKLVRFRHRDVVDMLARLGLMPRPPTSPPSALPPTPTPVTPQVETVQAAPTKKQRLGSQEQWIAPVALEIYGEDLPPLSPADLKNAIESRLRNKTLETPIPPDWKASWGACKRFLQKQGKLRSD